MTPKEITDEYARQIIAAVNSHRDGDDLFLVTGLLEEYGAKAFREGERNLAQRVVKYVTS